MRFSEIIDLNPLHLLGTPDAGFSAISDIANKKINDISKDAGLDNAQSKSGDNSTNNDSAGKGYSNFKSSGNQVDPKDIKSYLKSKGLDNNQVAGLVVSIKWESRFKPGAFVKSDNHQGPSGGFFGFHDPKFDGKGNFSDMVAYCGGPDKWATNWQKQLDFALSKNVGRQYLSQKFSSPGEAAAWWVINYEKPADTKGQAIARAKDAAQYA